MSRRVHIITVGASLIANAARDGALKSVRKAQRVDEMEEALRVGEVNRSEMHKELVAYIRQKGDLASAELSSMSDLLERYKIDMAYLLYTDTEVGEACSRALETYLREREVEVVRRKIEGYTDERAFSKIGLGNLAKEVNALIKKHKKVDRVYVCATGGFKPEAAMVTIIAYLTGAPVYYRHESFLMRVAIPPLPIEWHPKVMERYKDALMELINRDVPVEEFHKRFGEAIAREMRDDYMLIEEEADCYRLLPIGRLLYHAMFQI